MDYKTYPPPPLVRELRSLANYCLIVSYPGYPPRCSPDALSPHTTHSSPDPMGAPLTEEGELDLAPALPPLPDLADPDTGPAAPTDWTEVPPNWEEAEDCLRWVSNCCWGDMNGC